MNIAFLTLDDILAIHVDQITRYGGEPSIRDMGLLQSAVGMPEATFGGQYLHEFPHGMAAAYLFHIVANHAFVDGNKRTGLAAALVFLDWHGHRLDADHHTVESFVLSVASGKADKDECVAFFKQHVR